MSETKLNENFFLQIMETSQLEIAPAEQKILEILREQFNLAACSMYSLNVSKTGLVLRGQVGFRYRNYLDFSLGLDSLAGRVVKNGKPELVHSLKDASGFRDQDLISKYQLTSAVVLPISLRFIADQDFSLSICLYTKNSKDTKRLIENVGSIQTAIDHALSASTNVTLHNLRDQMIEKAMSVSDHYSFLHKALQNLTSAGFEAGSFFLYDERADCLRLAATTGLQDKTVRKADAFYRMNDTEHLTVQSFLQETAKEIDIQEIASSAPKYREATESRFHSAMVTPFFSPNFLGLMSGQKAKCYGVLRLTNKVLSHNSHRKISSFSWEDKLVVDYFLNLCSVVIHMFKKVEAKTSEFERVVHSLENNVLTVLGALHNIDEFAKQKIHFPDYISHSLPNSLAFMQSIHEQVRVFKTRDERELPKIILTQANLFGEVISKLPDYISSVARCYSAPGFKVAIDDFTKAAPSSSMTDHVVEHAYLTIPQILTDVELLLIVFKNLVENSVKYSQTSREAKVRISWCLEEDFVSVCVCDNGIGIPEEDADYIFNETYQAENAMRRRTSGAGIGLYQCRFIMEHLMGSIEYLRDKRDGEYTTCFAVKIPIFGV
ncbi:sensor histidine kinase [Sulfitobacter geojensis]|uniref:sensor histidine kinase n=1 Tax=Sulfitobacter geojensis TaxID=1342299 RepID=UPI00046B0270|nr:sensor histidine kinase [Sulfitobacter geojensis]KHA53124.1 Multi-sensor signal transduction histidine kinase [Sulfitobacter geojensis]NYI28217.1 signal transduction histidine kinase [Sulfitobacter geojensis]